MYDMCMSIVIVEKLVIPGPFFDGRWYGNAQILHDSSKMLKLMTVAIPNGR